MDNLTINDDLARRLAEFAASHGQSTDDMLRMWLDQPEEVDEMRRFFTLSRDILCVVDGDGHLLRVNKSFERILGYKEETVVGKHLLDLIHEDDREMTYAAMMRHISGDLVEFFENRYVCANGSYRWLSWSISPTTDNKTYAIARDITDRKHAEMELLERNQELDAFSGSVAHDLKTPIATIIGFASLMQAYQERLDHESLKYAVNEVIQSGFQAREIIDALLLLARVRKTDHVIIAPLDMVSVIENATERLKHQIIETKASIHIPESWPDVVGYAPWVEQVWVNYLSNAIKYGGEPPVVHLGSDQNGGGHVRFWVKDNGKGIQPEDAAKLFKPFTRLNNVRVEGHGLGLSIVKRIVERLGGKVSVESELEAGSQFMFTLPAP